MFRCGTSTEDIIAMVDVEMEYYYKYVQMGTSTEDIIAMVDVEIEDLDRIEKELEGLTEGYELLNFSSEGDH